MPFTIACVSYHRSATSKVSNRRPAQFHELAQCARTREAIQGKCRVRLGRPMFPLKTVDDLHGGYLDCISEISRRASRLVNQAVR